MLCRLLLDLTSLKKFDSQGMHKVYDIWPRIAKESYFSNLPQIKDEKCSHIVFAGMGGSGSIGDIFSAILSKSINFFVIFESSSSIMLFNGTKDFPSK